MKVKIEATPTPPKSKTGQVEMYWIGNDLCIVSKSWAENSYRITYLTDGSSHEDLPSLKEIEAKLLTLGATPANVKIVNA